MLGKGEEKVSNNCKINFAFINNTIEHGTCLENLDTAMGMSKQPMQTY